MSEKKYFAHETAVIDADCNIGEGTKIWHFSHIMSNCVIGENVNLLPNITIGENSIVGSGSTVIADVSPNSIVMGVPARRFGSIEKYKEKCIERWKTQKPKNIHPDALNPFWEKSPHQREILEQLEKHLKDLFRNTLK